MLKSSIWSKLQWKRVCSLYPAQVNSTPIWSTWVINYGPWSKVNQPNLPFTFSNGNSLCLNLIKHELITVFCLRYCILLLSKILYSIAIYIFVTLQAGDYKDAAIACLEIIKLLKEYEDIYIKVYGRVGSFEICFCVPVFCTPNCISQCAYYGLLNFTLTITLCIPSGSL